MVATLSLSSLMSSNKQPKRNPLCRTSLTGEDDTDRGCVDQGIEAHFRVQPAFVSRSRKVGIEHISSQSDSGILLHNSQAKSVRAARQNQSQISALLESYLHRAARRSELWIKFPCFAAYLRVKKKKNTRTASRAGAAASPQNQRRSSRLRNRHGSRPILSISLIVSTEYCCDSTLIYTHDLKKEKEKKRRATPAVTHDNNTDL